MTLCARVAPLLLITTILACAAPICAKGADAPASAAPDIHLNQLGFAPDARKLALVENAKAGSGFEVVREADGSVVLAGRLSSPARWKPAARRAAVADFSALAAPGTYRVRVVGLAPSDPFPISPQAYAGLADAALKAFYFNRASIALDPAHAGAWARSAGHADVDIEIHPSAASTKRPAGTVVSAPKGWYDAGDYNKYVVNSGIATWSLLVAFEHYPDFFRHRDIGIPESGDPVPDILDEAWWNLEWLLAMQDPGDGGVYHKLTNLKFDGMVMPQRATARRYMVGKSTAAALDFAAVMAIASRVYAPYESRFPGQPARMRIAAVSAWRWAQANPRVIYRQPEDVKTGTYGDDTVADEFAWAAAELYLLTTDATYWQAFQQHATAPTVPSWADVETLGWISLSQHRGRLPDAAARERIPEGVSALAARLATQWQASPWRVAMQSADFVWGSNAVALNQAIVLLQGYRLGGGRDQLDAAQSQLDYVLGRNPLGVSYVTGQGLRTPQHIHHRPSQADGIDAPVPGWLSGGPNPRQQDASHCPPYPSREPALSWLDIACSYASNEVAINWNAPLVYVAAGLQALTPAQ